MKAVGLMDVRSGILGELSVLCSVETKGVEVPLWSSSLSS